MTKLGILPDDVYARDFIGRAIAGVDLTKVSWIDPRTAGLLRQSRSEAERPPQRPNPFIVTRGPTPAGPSTAEHKEFAAARRNGPANVDVRLFGDLTHAQCGLICKGLEQWPAARATIVIDSPGGFLLAATRIRDAIRKRPGQTVCRVLGRADSAAGLVACSCEHVRMSRNGSMLVHWPHDYYGTVDHPDSRGVVVDILAWKSGHSAAVVRSWLDKSKRFSADEALSVGLVDEIF